MFITISTASNSSHSLFIVLATFAGNNGVDMGMPRVLGGWFLISVSSVSW